MTGKELVLVLTASLVFGGTAGVVGAHLAAPPPAQNDDTALLERVRRLEGALEDSQRRFKEADLRRARLSERLVETEIKVASLPQPDEATDDPEAGSTGTDTVKRKKLRKQHSAQEHQRYAAVQEKLAGAEYKLQRLIKKASALSTEEYKLAAELRRLSPEELWDKARDELFLTDGQVSELQAAIEDRNLLLKDAERTIESTIEGGRSFKFTTVDAGKAKEANKAFNQRVDNVLNTEQKTAWKEKGYARALGKRGGSRIHIVDNSDGVQVIRTKSIKFSISDK